MKKLVNKTSITIKIIGIILLLIPLILVAHTTIERLQATQIDGKGNRIRSIHTPFFCIEQSYFTEPGIKYYCGYKEFFLKEIPKDLAVTFYLTGLIFVYPSIIATYAIITIYKQRKKKYTTSI